jgi:IS1 family transposase
MWLFPPQTDEVQMDEKWAFVAKKQAHCDDDDPADDRLGDCWDHVALDPVHRLVLAAVPGKRTAENVQTLVQEVHRRTAGRMLNLITTDEYPAYKQAILKVYGDQVVPPRTGRRGRPKASYHVPPTDLNYATVHKTREKGRVVKIDYRIVFGDQSSVDQALARSPVSRKINTSFAERQHGTDRHRNARKVRKTYRFSKDPDVHNAMTYFSLYSYNYCWPVRTLRIKDPQGHWQPRTAAMAASLTDHVWSLTEWVTTPAVQRE